MAEKRMFSKRIIDSARFLKMPLSSQCLYFHLGLQADDDGVVEAYTVMSKVGASEDDLKVLVAKNFIVVLNEDLVSFIVDWKEHNKIRADRKVDSIYKNLLLQVLPDIEIQKQKPRADTGKITESHGGQAVDGQWTDNGPHRVDRTEWTAQSGPHRLGKDSIDKSRRRIIDNISLMKEDTSESDAFTLVFKEWEKIGMAVNGHTRDVIDEWIQEFETEWILEAIRRADERGHRTISYVKGILESFRNFGGIDDPTGKGKEQSEAAATAKKKKDAEAERQKRLDELYESYEEADDGTDSGGADTALRKLKGDLA